MTGRKKVGVGVIAVVSGVLAVATATAEDGERGPVSPPTPGKSDQPFRQPHVIRSEDGVLSARLTFALGTGEISGYEADGMMTVNGQYPGPTMKVNPGDRVELDIVNRLGESTNIHFHGLHVSPADDADNVLREMEDGTTNHVSMKIPKNHPTGLNWWHSHMHGVSQEQVYRGVSGMFLVEEERRQQAAQVAPLEERLFALQSVWAVDHEIVSPEDTTFRYTSAPTTINGQIQPRISIRPGERQFWGFANMDGRVYYRIRLDGQEFKVVGVDGEPFLAPEWQRTLLLAPGQRYEVVVRGGAPGNYKLRRLSYAAGDTGPIDAYLPQKLATLHVGGRPVRGPQRPLPPRHDTFEDLSDAAVDVEREWVLTMDEAQQDATAEQQYINGQVFDHARVDAEVELGTVEEWTFVNDSVVQHPMHVHTNDMQVMSIDGEPVEQLHATDTVNVDANGGEAVVRFRALRFTGEAVFHCHILRHEDGGMMGLINFVDDGSAHTSGDDAGHHGG